VQGDADHPLADEQLGRIVIACGLPQKLSASASAGATLARG